MWQRKPGSLTNSAMKVYQSNTNVGNQDLGLSLTLHPYPYISIWNPTANVYDLQMIIR